ncbi:hypothetical protein Bca4012_009523 [Brassica carinata]
MNPPKQVMKRLLYMLLRIWQVEGRVVGSDLGLGRFQFSFDEEEDIVEVLKIGPFHFDSWMISLVRWKPVVEVNYPSKIIFWVYVLDIPLQFRAVQAFQSVGEALGKVHGDVDMAEGRVRVEVDGFKPLIFSMTIDFYEGVEIPVSLRYEKLVGFFEECFCMTHDKSLCPLLNKGVEAGRDGLMYQLETGVNATSYRGAVANGREQGGDRREGQQDRLNRGYGEGSSLAGKQPCYHGPREQDRRQELQYRGSQQPRGDGEGPQLNPEKLMLDAFKGVDQFPQMKADSQVNEMEFTASKTRKALLFEEAADAVGANNLENLNAELKETQEEKEKEADTGMEEVVPNSEAFDTDGMVLEDGEFDDSDLLVDSDELQHWEQGEIADYQEELEGGDSNEEGILEETLEELNEEVKHEGVSLKKEPKKKAQKGSKRTAQTILSPRKKLLAKAVAKMGGKGMGQAKKFPPKVFWSWWGVMLFR